MKTLILPREVVEIAFSPLEHVTEAAVTVPKIKAAELCHLEPALGELYDALLEGKYEDFTRRYIKPALAYFVRYGVIPDLAVKITNSGAQTVYTDHTNAATDRQRDTARAQAKSDADAYLMRAIRELEAHPEIYIEYKPRRITSCAGGIVLPKLIRR